MEEVVMELSQMLYVNGLDALAVIGALAVVVALVAPVLSRRGPMEAEDWTRLRLSFVLPLAVPIFVAVVLGLNFGCVRLVFHVGATVYPVAGLLLLWAVRRRGVVRSWHRGGAICFAVVNLALLPLAGWMVFVEPYRLEVTETPVVSDAAPAEPIRVVVLADVQTDHFGAWEESVLREVNTLDADLIVLPGDFLQTPGKRYHLELPGALDFLSRLRATHGVFVVDGDADARVSDYAKSGATVLENEIVELEIHGRRVALAGTQLEYFARPVARTIGALEAHDAELKLLLAHRPMTATTAQVPDSSIDLVIAGHTHGGQINLPLVGPPVTLSDAPRDVCAGGLHRLGGRPIYVSRGVGMERLDAPRMRLGARPEVALLLIE
jgi:predicted MPP superfamily phosphohydrolase